MKKVLFFDRLDYFTLIVAILLKPFFNQVVFRRTFPFFQNLKNHKYLNFFGITCISFHKVSYKIFHNTFKISLLLEKKYIENQVSTSNLVKKFINEFKLKKKQIAKLYLCFRNDSYQQNEKNSEGQAVVLINNFFPENDYKVYFVPYNPLSYLLLKITV